MLAAIPPAADALGRMFARHGHELALVGGPVRDLFLDRPVSDLDLTTDAHPERVIEITSGWADSTWTVGIAYGTIGLRKGDTIIEITTYRSESELAERFGRNYQGNGDPLGKGGQFAVQSYLAHHARKLARRFDANTYIRLAQAIQSHDVGRDRGGVETALARFTNPALVVAVDSDRLYPLKNSQRLDAALSGSDGVKVVHSPVGHDGFLVESGQLNAFMADFETAL